MNPASLPESVLKLQNTVYSIYKNCSKSYRYYRNSWKGEQLEDNMVVNNDWQSLYCVEILDQKILGYRFPVAKSRRTLWISKQTTMSSDQVMPHSRVCSRHFHTRDTTKQPQLNLGKRFAPPRKKSAPREVRARRDANKKCIVPCLC